MGEIFAVVVGVEKYQKLPSVLFARSDALAISTALEDLGCPLANQAVLTDGEATKTAIDAELREMLLSRVRNDDQCFIFFAGHGLCEGSFNYLAAHDTRLQSLDDTGVRLQRVLGFVKNCPSKRIVVFLDACHTGIEVEETMRSPVKSGIALPTTEQYCAGFASCRSDQKSYSSKKLKQGIWTHHLLKALRGEVKTALEGTLLTAPNLQKYLAAEVPRTILWEFDKPQPQSPRLFGSYESVGPVADLGALLARRQAEQAGDVLKFDRVALVSATTEYIPSMRGFDRRKGHFEPESVSKAADQFVRNLATEEIREHVDHVYELLRTRLKVKLRDIVHGVEDGVGTIRVPAFDYEVSAQQDYVDPRMALWRYQLTEVRDPSIVNDAAFNEVFRSTFDTVEFAYQGKTPNLLDLASDLEDADYDVDFPRNGSQLSFVPEGGTTKVVVTPGTVEFVFPRKEPPKVLVAGFQATRALLAGTSPLQRLFSPPLPTQPAKVRKPPPPRLK